MHSTKYIIFQEENGWRGYLEGYPEHEAQGESFEDLQAKLWQLHQDLTSQEREQEREPVPYRKSEHHHYYNSTPTMSRPLSRAQIKRRALVEQLLFAVISNR
jgi:predicted RNase H-like HicB family nuclease